MHRSNQNQYYNPQNFIYENNQRQPPRPRRYRKMSQVSSGNRSKRNTVSSLNKTPSLLSGISQISLNLSTFNKFHGKTLFLINYL